MNPVTRRRPGRHVRSTLCAAVPILIAGCQAWGQTTELRPGSMVVGALSHGQTVRYTIDADENEFFLGEVDQLSVDVDIRILDPAGTMSRSGSIDFGYQGRPLYIPAPDDNQVGIILRLIEAVGLGNFYYLPRGDVPEEVAELLRVEQPEEPPESAIWTPELQQRGGVDDQSGLWVPGQQPEPASEGEKPEQSLIWTPGRS